jgi:hypothetical protein
MLSGKRLAFRSVLVVEWDKTLKLASARKNVSDLCLQFHQILFYRIYSILFIDRVITKALGLIKKLRTLVVTGNGTAEPTGGP